MSSFESRFEEFKRALERLKEAYDSPRNDLQRDACIQRFEFTYELSWKALKKYLAIKGIDVRNAKDTLKAGYEQGIIEDADNWSGLHANRNLTSHTYDLNLAEDVYAFVGHFGIPLFEALKLKLEEVST